MSIFGERLKSLIGEKSIRSVAKESGVSAASLSLYISNKRKPTLDAIELLADYFGVSTDYLLGRSEMKNPLKKEHEIEYKELQLKASKY
ncbi:MAG TPA: helix-turn-helix transcriptional regulator, partial [Thermotogota bacterium]|nr:helix-turn-helix transcriptional regulator [Thermotogota bacterium]